MSSSGKHSDGRRSNFARTCNLLSRFVKEKGSLRDLNLEIGGKVESLEEIVKLGSSTSNSGKSGKVLVFDDYPAEKIKCLVSIAKKSSSRTSYGVLPTNHAAAGLPPRSSKQRVGISKTNFSRLRSRSGEKRSHGFGSDLPIARRSSLHKFLEKRNDRVGLSSMAKGDEQFDLNLMPQVA